MRASWERRRLAGQEVAIAASFVLAKFGTLRLSPKAVVEYILLPPGRLMPPTFGCDRLGNRAQVALNQAIQ